MNLRWWRTISLRVRVYTVLTALVAITLVGGLIMVWYTYRMESLLADLVDKNLAAYQVAEALESALIQQRGDTSHFLLDGDARWLEALGESQKTFKTQLARARVLTLDASQKHLLDQLDSEYLRYTILKDQSIEFFKTRDSETAQRLLKEVSKAFSRVLELCRQFKDFYTKRIALLKDQSYAQAEKLRPIAGTAVLAVLLLGIVLAFVLVNDILEPLRRLAQEANPGARPEEAEDEVKVLSRSVRGLIEGIDQTQTELEKSREHLLQAEKMVVVGKLAANMAHSIRNPLTSVKMRLFSLDRSLDLNPQQKEDFQVISEEILHIDSLVQSFLEFSRPPKLRMQTISPSEIVDLALKLMTHRLESYQVSVQVERGERLPLVQADPDRLKEVLVNILVNACEAMKGGGSMVIREEETLDASLGQVAVVRIRDSGPGIEEGLREKIFQPFFTTKEEGSGLGLSIAARIVEEHGGLLNLESREGQGAEFSLILPVIAT
ncbi:MAG: ATP-binding protein [Desulfobacterota bacterium]|nr:ATP-binding protein [Thermodesulfobacteriota bacterium]